MAYLVEELLARLLEALPEVRGCVGPCFEHQHVSDREGCRRSHSCVGLALRCIRRGCDLRLLAVSHAASSEVVSARGASPPGLLRPLRRGRSLTCGVSRPAITPGRPCGRLCGGCRTAGNAEVVLPPDVRPQDHAARGHRPGPRPHSQTPAGCALRGPRSGARLRRCRPLAEVPDGYRAMDDRSALKVRITVRVRGPAARVWFLPCRVAPS